MSYFKVEFLLNKIVQKKNEENLQRKPFKQSSSKIFFGSQNFMLFMISIYFFKIEANWNSKKKSNYRIKSFHSFCIASDWRMMNCIFSIKLRKFFSLHHIESSLICLFLVFFLQILHGCIWSKQSISSCWTWFFIIFPWKFNI